jgi:hypothetical protein
MLKNRYDIGFQENFQNFRPKIREKVIITLAPEIISFRRCWTLVELPTG